MELRKRTPKSIEEALNNGLNEAGFSCSYDQLIVIKKHVQDFVAQKFTSAMMGMGKVSDLYRTLFDEE